MFDELKKKSDAADAGKEAFFVTLSLRLTHLRISLPCFEVASPLSGLEEFHMLTS